MKSVKSAETMNGKPVYYAPAKTVLNLESGFRHKLLCDGPTFSAGTACAYSCSFCYVPNMMQKSPHLAGVEEKHEDVVIRRLDATDILLKQLINGKGQPRFNDPTDKRVLYMSPLVDVAANADLVAETVSACILILRHTPWQIRILSKSALLKQVAIHTSGYRDRMMFGLSTGTLNDDLAKSFEIGTSKVSARLKTLHWLQNEGFRTYGMICPSLPQEVHQQNYDRFAIEMHDALRADKCEHVWAEGMNVRGESLTNTVRALRAAGFQEEAIRLQRVSTDPLAWEDYSRATFLAHAPLYPQGKLRFMQYVTKQSRAWWQARKAYGAICL